MNKKYIKKEYI